LFIVLSLFTLYLFAMGYVVTSFVKAGGNRFAQAALTIAVGILINYCLMLTGQPIVRVLMGGMGLALWGIVKFGKDLRGRPATIDRESRAIAFSLCGITYILAIYYLNVFSEPLLHWDTRSIWFFHARMIWTEGALSSNSGWSHPSLEFSHPDYPKLVPAIAAELGYLRGYWNEFLPKASLLVMLAPLTLWVFGFRQKRASFVLLVLVFFFSVDSWLSTGYMDWYLALYCGVALLSFGRYLSEGRDSDLYSGVCALGIGASIKNEGMLFGVCLITALVVMGPVYPALRPAQFWRRLRADSRFAVILVLSIAPTLMWTIQRRAWGLHNDLAGDPSAGLTRLSTRLFDGFSPWYVLNYLTVRASAIWMVIGLLAVTLAFFIHQRLKVQPGAIVAATTSVLYVCGLYVIYLSTPLDLNFHLGASAVRTMSTASLALLVGLFFLLSSLEANEARTP